MEKRPLDDGAPVAAVERVVAEKFDRPRDIAPAVARHHQQHAVGERRPDALKERARQIGAAPFARAGVHVEGEERVPVLRLYVAAGEQVDLDVVAQSVAPFALDRLALARGEEARKSSKSR